MAATVRSETEMKKDVRQLIKEDVVTDPLEKLRLQCLARGCGGIKSFARMFRIIDDNGNRRLDMDEFCKGCSDYGATLSKDELGALFRTFDVDRNGTIDFEEFLMALRALEFLTNSHPAKYACKAAQGISCFIDTQPPMSAPRQQIVMEAFRKLDVDNDGIIKVNDIEKHYSVHRHPKFLSGEATKEQLFKEFLRTFEGGSQHADGMVTKDEFLNYYSGVSASIDSDAYFDLMMRNAWRL